MKYLRKFNESKFEKSFINQYKRIESELNDILLPFNDDGIKYHIHHYSDDGIGEVTISIGQAVLLTTALNVKFFTWSQIKEEMLHVISFMDSEGIGFSKLETQQFIGNEFHNIEIYDQIDIEELEDDFKFTEFNITFSKLS